MSIFKLAWRSLTQHRVSSLVTIFSIALATGLVMAVFAIQAQSYAAFTGGAGGFDAVLGARGSQLQLVLNTVFHLETSPGNIPWSLYQAISQDPRVARAIPYAVGDNYRGFRIVGTSPELFQEGFQLAPGGQLFEPTSRQAVIGSFVAQRTGLKPGSQFHPYHGVVFSESARHDEEYTVVGVLEPTSSPADRVIWIPLEGIFRMSGHVLRGSGKDFQARPDHEIPDQHKQISAVMLELKSSQAGFALEQTINKQGQVATLAWPVGRVMAELFDKLGWMNRVLALVAYLVVAVALASILAGLYNTIDQRRRELAILRALGAPRRTLLGLILLESGLLAGLGSLAGLLVYTAILAVAVAVVRSQTGVVLEVLAFHPVLVLAPLGVTALGTLAGLLPAWKAYRTDVASNLAPPV
ncbi:ABC transporter permease [bacterium CPR1]|nr:ABC transporter permease [bacterium CPR1]